MTVTLAPTDRWAGQPADFNRAAADTVFKAIMDCPDDDTAAIVSRVLVEGLVQHELLTKGYELAAAADTIAAACAELLTKRLASSALSKARRHEDASGEVASIALLSKAFDFTDEQREHFARERTRDLHSGRFVREHQPIAYQAGFKGVSDAHGKTLGIPAAPHLKDESRARYQEAYRQVERLIAPFTGLGDKALIHLHVADKDGNVTTSEMPMPGKSDTHNLAGHLANDKHLHSVSVSAVPPTTAAGAAFDALAPLSPTAAGVAYNTVHAGAGSTDRLSTYRSELERNHEQDDFVPSQRVFRNIESSSKLLRDSLGDAAPAKVKMALAVGEHVGRYGPEAQKVIGPTADKAAYRYRGTERGLPQPMVNALTQLRNLTGVENKRWYLLHGNARGDGSVPHDQWQPSGVLEYLRTTLPKADLSTLHLKSGAVPPSRGFVFDRNGQTTVEAVGYGDDHYLPFNLRGRSFRKLKGGEYIRTRSFGGPTTEDIYGGLMSGATGLAVVSHNGVYTVDFAADLKGGKRFNDNAARMVGRYGYLLDAVRSKQVETGGIAPSRDKELRDKAEARFPEARFKDRYDPYLDELRAHEKKHPELSDQQRQRAALEFFSEQAPLGRGAGDLRQSMVAGYVRDEATMRWQKNMAEYEQNKQRYPDLAADPAYTPRSLETYETEVRDELTGLKPDQIGGRYAEILNMKPQFDAFMRRAEQDNADRLKPLRLNGEGYHKALVALQEEFPHYIADVQFHPWTDVGRRGPLDSGYVRPRHNRAAEALSGYFDTKVSRTGQGKVYADSTRWQNRNQEVRPVEPPKKQGSGGAGGTGTKTPEADAGTAAALRRDADLQLYTTIRNAQKFSPDAADAGALSGQDLSGAALDRWAGNAEVRAALEAAAPNIFSLRAMTPDQFEAAYAAEPERTRQKMAGALKEDRTLHWLDIGADVGGAFERGGKAIPKRTLGEHPSVHLDHPNAELDLGDESPAYDAAMRPKAGMVSAEYGANDTIDRLVKAGGLPDSVASDEFGAMADKLVESLAAQRKNILNQARREGYIPTEADWAQIDDQAEGVLRARQLRRRYDAAVSDEKAAAVGPVQSLEQQLVSNEVNFQLPPRQKWETPEDYAKTQVEFMFQQAERLREEEADREQARKGGPKGFIEGS